MNNELKTIALSGRIDSLNAADTEQKILDDLQGISGVPLVFDMEKLDYISSAGLRVLLSAHKNMSKKGSMKLIHVGSSLMEIFEVTGFSDILTIE